MTAPPSPAPAGDRARRTMLLALTFAFALSQAYRTLPAVMAPPLQAEFGASPQALGLFAGAFHFAFGAMQLLVGVGIDLYGIRRTVLAAMPLAVAGATLAALAPRFEWLVLGQALLGLGCAPAFLACTVFVARSWPVARFAAVSGLVMGLGGIGMLATGTPLAWLVAGWSWRAGFAVLAVLSVVSWVAIRACLREPPLEAPAPRESVGVALRRFAELLTLPHTAGILALASVAYASFLALRGLWLGPMLVERHGMSLVNVGNVALAVSLTSMVGPILFGRFDPGPRRRRHWLVAGTLASAAAMAVLAAQPGEAVDVLLPIAFGVLSGYMMLQYADVRAAYPAAITGRALALFTMAMFLGVAVMQAFTGWVASNAPAWGIDRYTAVLATMSTLLTLAAIAYALLPKPDHAHA